MLLDRKQSIFELLSFTLSLTFLEIHLCEEYKDDNFTIQNQTLESLEKLVIKDYYDRKLDEGWIEGVRRAAPTELKVVINSDDGYRDDKDNDWFEDGV